jgi:hypothetical protein
MKRASIGLRRFAAYPTHETVPRFNPNIHAIALPARPGRRLLFVAPMFYNPTQGGKCSSLGAEKMTMAMFKACPERRINFYSPLYT